MYHTSVAYRILDTKDYIRLGKKGVRVQFIYSNRRSLIVEFRVDATVSKSKFNALENLAIVICGGMGDFDNYCEFNNIEFRNQKDFNEYKRQVDIYKKLEKFFSYKDFDGSIGTHVIDYAKEFFYDWLNDGDFYSEHYKL